MMAHDHSLIIAVGHEYRSDDGFGACVLRKLQSQKAAPYDAWLHVGDASDLLERWSGRDVIVIDACESCGNPGRLQVLRPLIEPCLLAETSISSHGLGVQEAIALSGLLGKLPRELTVLTVEGQNFSPGHGLSPPVADALDDAVCQLKALLDERATRNA